MFLIFLTCDNKNSKSNQYKKDLSFLHRLIINLNLYVHTLLIQRELPHILLAPPHLLKPVH